MVIVEADWQGYMPSSIEEALSLINRVGHDNLSIVLSDGTTLGYLHESRLRSNFPPTGELAEIWFGDQRFGLSFDTYSAVEAYIYGFFTATFHGASIASIHNHLDTLDRECADHDDARMMRLKQLLMR